MRVHICRVAKSVIDFHILLLSVLSTLSKSMVVLFVGMGQVQNGHLYIRCKGSSRKKQCSGTQDFNRQHHFAIYSIAKSTPYILLTFLKGEKTKIET